MLVTIKGLVYNYMDIRAFTLKNKKIYKLSHFSLLFEFNKSSFLC